ncbi:MAG: GMC family oxidoreductase [Planctomycetes bacterium]|nr:GMC family oxidoreductase [Planctomycetota bacterium]
MSPPRGIYSRSDWPQVPDVRVRNRRFGGDLYELSCDVVVVGSGAGGAVVAAELAEGGLDVVVLEEGGYYATEDFNADVTQALGNLYRDGGAQMALGTPPVTFAEGRCVGGSTVINGGMTWRTPEHVIRRWAEDHGVAHCTPDALLPHFERVEGYLSAGIQSPESIGRDNTLLKEGAEALGYDTIPNIRNQLHCVGSNNCAFGCPTGAKQSTLLTYLPRALHFGARILTHCRVDNLLRRRKQVTGVEGSLADPSGKTRRFRVHARETVISCGAVQTPNLLLRSGLRSPSGRIGHGLTLHPNTKVVALFDEDVEGWKGVHQAYQVREFEDDGFLMAAVNIPPSLVAMTMPYYGQDMLDLLDQYKQTVVGGVLIEDTTSGRVRSVGGLPVPTYQITEEDRQRIVRGTAIVCDVLFAAGAKRIVLPFEGVPDLHSRADVERLRQTHVPKSAMEVVTVHIMGTAAMGGDPTRHVCDSYGRVYDFAGLSVADASLFPTPIGVNPMETIMTLATRCAIHLLDRFAVPAGAR